jgi:hypothetical protein
LYAQDSSYFLDLSGNEPRFTQRISWIGDDYASGYEVVIERERTGAYRELLRDFTATLFIEVSLAPGKYRCYVTPYDFLGERSQGSELFFEVLAALYPELDVSLVEFVYSDTDLRSEDPVFEMNLFGSNLVSGADIELRDSNGERIVPFAVYINEDGTGARLSFYKEQLLPGNYELIVKNPGGLEAGVTVTVESGVPKLADAASKRLSLFLGAAWIPSVTIYDRGERFDGVWSPMGAAIRFGIVFTKPYIINLGAELIEAWSAVYDGSDGRATHLDSTVNFLMQKQSASGKTALTIRLGIGFSLPLLGYNEDIPLFADLFYTNVGVSFMVFVWNNMYLEGGIDYAHWFSGPFSGNFRPWFGIGLRF